MTVVKSSPFTNLSSDMYALIFGYLPEPESLGNALSTCKRLRYNLNNQESLWQDMAKKLVIPQAKGKTWRESVITYIQWQKNIFQETILECPPHFEDVQYDDEGNISLSSASDGWTYDKNSKKKILEYRANDRNDKFYVEDRLYTQFFSNEYIAICKMAYFSLSLLINVKNKQKSLFNFSFIQAKYIFETSIILYCKISKKVKIFDTKVKQFSEYHPILSYNFPRKNSDFWMYKNNQVLIYDVKENKVIKTIPFVALPNLLTAVAIQNVFIQITKNEIVGYRFNEDQIKKYVAGEPSPFTQEIWRHPFSEAHEKIELLLPKDHSILFGVQNKKYANKFQFFNSQDGKFLGERTLPIGISKETVFVHFDACHFINENIKFVIRDFSPILPEKLKKLDVEKPKKIDVKEQKKLDVEEPKEIDAEEQRKLDAEEQKKLALEELKKLDAEEQKKLDIEERKKHTILAKTLDKIKWLFKGSLLKKIGVIALTILGLVGVGYSIKKFS